jgi:hypothetical protein
VAKDERKKKRTGDVTEAWREGGAIEYDVPNEEATPPDSVVRPEKTFEKEAELGAGATRPAEIPEGRPSKAEREEIGRRAGAMGHDQAALDRQVGAEGDAAAGGAPETHPEHEDEDAKRRRPRTGTDRAAQ